MKTVILKAPLLSISGYGTHCRQIFRWLMSRPDVTVQTMIVPWGITSWMVNPELEDGLIGEIMSRSVPHDQKGDISIQVQLPNEWNTGIAPQNIGVSAFVETDVCSPGWLENCNAMDTIVVPSQHVKDCIINSGGIETPLHVIPESYYDIIADQGLEPLDIKLDTDFNFLMFGQVTGTNPENDRKNLFYTIKWMCEEFANCKDVGIVLKTNSGKNTKIDKLNTRNMLFKLVSEIRKGPYPKFHFLHGSLSQLEIARLYRHPKIKALLSLTRGEGFGLPLLEAAASGLPVIATGWSGHLDFLSLGKFLDVKYQLAPIHESRVDGQIFIPGSKWAQPSEEDAKKRVRKFYNSSRLPSEWAADLRKKIIPTYSQDAINKIYNEKLASFFND